VETPAKLVARRGASVESKLSVTLKEGYHTNSNTPSESYLIPFKLTWDESRVKTLGITYPKAHMEKYEFTNVPLSVFTGSFDIVTKFQVPAAAMDGPGVIAGKLRYQACTQTTCLPPKTVDVKIPVIIQ
jgi:hypothetical protein